MVWFSFPSWMTGSVMMTLMGMLKWVRNVKHVSVLPIFPESWHFHQVRAYSFSLKEPKQIGNFISFINFRKSHSPSHWLLIFLCSG